MNHSLRQNHHAAASFGFRNVSLLVKEQASGHIVEVQFSLASLEAIKNSWFGHLVFEVSRRAGMTSREISGSPDAAMAGAVATGQAAYLKLDSGNIDPATVDVMVDALASPGCRTRRISCLGMTGGGRVAFFEGIVARADTVVERG